MRKSRIKLGDVEEKIFTSIQNSPNTFFDYTERLAVNIPAWAKIIFILLAEENGSVEIQFFEDAKDFFMSYTKKSLKSKVEYFYICFSREDTESWVGFKPPTLIGPNLTTKMRKQP